MPDLALGLQDSLDRFGRGGMEVPFKVPDGSGVAPGYAFVNEPSLGFYRAGAGQLGVAVGGAGRLFLSSTLWDSIVPMRLNAQNAGTQLTIKQGSAQTEAILRVISNDELTEYLAIDNAGQVTIDDLNASQATIDDLVVSNTPTIPGYATLGANTFTSSQTLESTAPTLYYKETGVTANNTLWRTTVNGEALSFQVVNDAVNAATSYFTVERTLNNIDSVTVSTSGSSVSLTPFGVNIAGTAVQANGVGVATVDTNWLLSDITDVTATAIEVNYTDGVTSAIQPQLNSKAPISNPTFTGEIGIGTVNVSQAELGILEGATLTTTELNYVDGVASAIQPQLNLKAPLASPALTGAPTVNGAAVGAIGANTYATFGGFVSSAGTANQLPSGWSAVRASTGLYTITHNLGVSGISDFFATANAYGSAGVVCDITAITTNSFQVECQDSAAQVAQDSSINFICATF